MAKLEQNRTRGGQVFPFPRDGEKIFETPPCLTWLKAARHDIYKVEIFSDDKIFWQGETRNNYIVPDIILPVGDYTWNLISDGDERGLQCFTIDESAVEFIRPTCDEILDAVTDTHPRIMFGDGDIETIKASKSAELETLARNVELALSHGFPERPMFHRDPNALPYREYFGEFRDWCDRDMIACAISYKLLGDIKAGEHAKELLLIFCDWNSDGPCSLYSDWGDEIGLSLARCLPTAYDLLFDLLDPKLRKYVAHSVASYALQCEKRLDALDFCQNPGSSHAGRIPAYMGEAAIALVGSDISRSTLQRWLTKALDIYGGIFPYYGCIDGGWAEGTFYSTSYTKWYLPFFLAVERLCGKSFLSRPFYRNYIQYLMYFSPPNLEIHPFCDGYWCKPDDAEWPGFFAQNPYRIYAERYNPKSEECRRLALSWEKKLCAPEIFKLHLMDIFVPESKSPKHTDEDVKNLRVFGESGFVSMHTDLFDRVNDTALLTRASKFGSVSHRHPDQGSFSLFKGGVALISPSGYFGRQYGSRHHFGWTNSTRAHNCVLIDGEGQKPFDFTDVGEIISAEQYGDMYSCSLGLSNAYPMLRSYVRQFELTENFLYVTDYIESENEVEVTWLLHALSMPEMSGNSAIIRRGGFVLTATPVEGELDRLIISDKFAVDINEGEPKRYHVEMPPQYHISWRSPRSNYHTIKVRFSIRAEENEGCRDSILRFKIICG